MSLVRRSFLGLAGAGALALASGVGTAQAADLDRRETTVNPTRLYSPHLHICESRTACDS